MEFPEMAEIWPRTDYPRLGTILATGIGAFAQRLRV
jgi:hypothetical protein